MAVRIRLKRTGRTNNPSYRIVAADARAPRDGRVIETLGTYDPLIEDEAKQVTLDVERAKYWLSVGAETTDTVGRIMKNNGLIPRPK